MINYVWQIANLERNTADDGVVIAHWRCTATDSETEATASNYGTASFQPDPAKEDYVAFDALTEEVVIGWVQGEVDKTVTEEALANKIEAINNPPTVSGLPW